MREQKKEADCIAIQRYNCVLDKNDIENWKKWFVQVQRPMNYILAAALILAGILSGIFMFMLQEQFREEIGDSAYPFIGAQKEIFFMQIGIVMSMFAVLFLGNVYVRLKIPRPKLERCLELHFYKTSFSLFYCYRKNKEKVYIDNFTYQTLEFIKLEHNILLINGRKFQLGTQEASSFLTAAERCKYRRYHGYLQGIYQFSYDADIRNLISQVCEYKDKIY